MAIELTTATSAELSGIRQSLKFTPTLDTIFPNAQMVIDAFNNRVAIFGDYGNIVDFKNCNRIQFLRVDGFSSITTLLNAQDLTSLENVGTIIAANLSNCSIGEAALNQFFTDLPATSKTATINVAGNPGAATCDTTIATNKGYTVVTS